MTKKTQVEQLAEEIEIDYDPLRCLEAFVTGKVFDAPQSKQKETKKEVKDNEDTNDEKPIRADPPKSGKQRADAVGAPGALTINFGDLFRGFEPGGRSAAAAKKAGKAVRKQESSEDDSDDGGGNEADD